MYTRDRGRPKKDWMANIIQWTDETVSELLEKVKDSKGWIKCVIGVVVVVGGGRMASHGPKSMCERQNSPWV